MTPFTFHWYAGLLPPLTGIAVKVTELPGQNGFVEAEMDIPAGRFAFTTIVIEFDVAGLPTGQAIFDVITQEITSPLFGE